MFDASVIQSFGHHNMWQSGFNPIKCGVPLAKHGNRTLVLVGIYGPTAAMTREISWKPKIATNTSQITIAPATKAMSLQ